FKELSQQRIDRDRGLKWELDVHGGPLRQIPLPLKLDFLSAASYHGKAQTSGEVIFKQLALPDVTDRDILIVDDILDSGHTLAAVCEKLETAKPRSVRVCVLLSKKKQRARCVDTDYVGF
ncbi:MAG: hypothetical protein DME82_06335, partial [Verrucomicrobia bacterium]